MSSAGTTTVTRGFQYKHGDKPLDGYTIQRAAGRGGFGEVYYAVSDSGREVALKLVLTYEQIELRGISHCMNLKSPHLITIFDVKYGQDGRPWVIMEFVSGPSLRDLIDAAPSGLGVQKSAFFLREIAKGLTYLHECGIVHRDLKPGNIFYENGYVKIGDYGLSKAMSTSQYSGQTVTVGTVHYMAPEIGQGRYDKSIDIYALGTLLFEMLTGQVPFFGASPSEVLMKHLTAQADVAGIEEPFATVIRKAMAKDPTERYQSVQEMVEAVFGAEHVRNSVSHFTPESLTMVAGQVARKLPGNSSFAPSSGATNPAGPANPANPWDRFGRNVQKSVDLLNDGIANHVNRVVTNKLDRAARKFEAKRQRIERKFGRKWDRRARRLANGQPQVSLVADDPVSAGQRKALAAVATGLVAVGTGVAAHDHRSAPVVVTVIFAGLAILGTIIGARMGMRRLLPGLPAEPKLLRRLAVGGCAAAFATLMGIAFAAKGDHGNSLLGLIIGVLTVEWERRAWPNREARVNLGNVVKALIWGVVLGAVTDGSGWLVGGILAGASLALEILSPWSISQSKKARNRAADGSPAVPPIQPPHPIQPAPMMQQQQMGPRGMQQSQSMPAHGFANPVMPPPLSPTFAPPIAFARPVGRGARALWLVFSVILTTIGLCLLGTLLADGVRHDDERAMFLGFGALTTIMGIFCLRRSLGGPAAGKWTYFFRPVLQILCIGTMIISLSMITIGNIHSSDVPPAIFAIVFPAVVFTVITFFAGRGGTMSQSLMAPLPAAVALSPAADDGFSVAGLISGTGRLAASVFGSAILGIAVLIAIAVAADIPGLLNSHLMDPQFHREIEQNFGRSDWPRLVRGLGMIASFVLAVMALAIHMRVRRRHGAIHMLRAVVSVVLVFLAVQMLGRMLPSWSAIQAASNGWEFIDQYLSHINDHRLFGLAVPAGAGIILWFWPAERKRVPTFAAVQQEMAR